MARIDTMCYVLRNSIRNMKLACPGGVMPVKVRQKNDLRHTNVQTTLDAPSAWF
jgi:hypothetical protein